MNTTLRKRLTQGSGVAEPHDPLKAAIWQATLPFQEELRSTGGVTFMGLRNAIAEAVKPLLKEPTTPET